MTKPSHLVALLRSLADCVEAEARQASPPAMKNVIAGLKPERQDGSTIKILRGSCWCLDTCAMYEQPGEVLVPVTGFANGSEVYVWLIRDVAGNVVPVVNSARFQGDVPLPEGCKLVRKLPFGCMFNSAWGGLPAWHIAHWPLPEVTFTESEDNSLWQACSGLDTGDAWKEISLAKWIPDNARMALVVPEVTMKSGGTRAGSAYWRSVGACANGEKLGSANPSFGVVGGERTVRVTSTRTIFVKTTGDAAISVRVKGYQQTEAS